MLVAAQARRGREGYTTTTEGMGRKKIPERGAEAKPSNDNDEDALLEAAIAENKLSRQTDGDAANDAALEVPQTAKRRQRRSGT